MIGVVGDVDPDELAALAARRFGALRGGERDAARRAGVAGGASVQRSEPRDKAQTALALLFPGPARGDDARFAAAMIAGVASGLGGRFFDELRDKQSLAYTVHAFASERALAGAFVRYIATSPEKEEVARRGLLARVREAARRAGDGRRSWSGRRRTRSARTRSASRAAARCSARWSTRGCSATAGASWRSTTRACAR